MKIAVAVINGLGSQEQFYSVEFKHLVVEAYQKLGENRSEDDFVFQEIYWGDIVKEKHARLLETANYKKDLTYMSMRQQVIDVFGASLAYHSKTNSMFYPQVSNRISDNLKRLAGHRRVDKDTTPLVILAHSFGSVAITNYIYDVQKARAAGEMSELSPLEGFDTLAGVITFGSPLGLFSLENNEFEKPIAKAGGALPDDFKRRVKWLNFYDKDDILAYPLKSLNDAYNQVIDEDIEINVGSATTSWNPACHYGYWEDKDFVQPVAHYLSELMAPHVFWE